MSLSTLSRQLRDRAASIYGAFLDPTSRTGRGGRSIGWITLGRISINVARLGSNLLTTLILLPEAFALMSLVYVIHGGLGMITDAGLEASVVRSQRGEDPAFLRTAFVVNFLRNLALSVIMLLVAAAFWVLQVQVDLGTTVYAHPELPLIMALSAIPIVINGLVSPVMFLASRRVEMRQVTLIGIFSSIVSLAGMVAMVWLTEDNLALLMAPLLASGITSFMSHRLAGPRMAFEVDRPSLQEIWGFGRWIMGASFMRFVSMQGDRLLTSGLLDIQSFALFTIARMWIDATSLMVEIATKTTRGLVAEAFRESVEAHLRVTKLLRKGLLVLSFAAFAGAFFILPTMIETLYRSQYHAVAPIVAALAGSVLWRLDIVVDANAIARGNSRFLAMVQGVASATLLIALPTLHHFFGLAGVVLAVVLTGFVGHAINSIWFARSLGQSIWVAAAGLALRGVIGFGAAALGAAAFQ
ncbi:MAG: oligosaccharide flippase family protein [Pseudomonadota bacterium]